MMMMMMFLLGGMIKYFYGVSRRCRRHHFTIQTINTAIVLL